MILPAINLHFKPPFSGEAPENAWCETSGAVVCSYQKNHPKSGTRDEAPADCNPQKDVVS